MAESHDDTSEGAVHYFHDEEGKYLQTACKHRTSAGYHTLTCLRAGNLCQYTFGESSTGMAAHVASVRHLLRQPQASSDVTASSEREKQRGSLWEVSSDDSAVVVVKQTSW